MPWDLVTIDNDLASLYGGNAPTPEGPDRDDAVSSYYTNAFGRGCVNGADGFTSALGCDYNGPRWFAGPSPANNETKVGLW
jgi:hypothetical protein